MSEPEERHHLDRFLKAQDRDYTKALAELRNGQKRSHWIWYIFPQIQGLGRSHTAMSYAIKDLDEAKAYLAHSTLGPRLIECCEAILAIEGKTAEEIMGGFPDDVKLRSCLTLFEAADPSVAEFSEVLDRYFSGNRDERTLEILDEF